MNDNDFLNRLSAKFKLGEIDVEDIKAWLIDEDLKGKELYGLYEKITRKHQYKTISLAHIINVWRDNKSDIVVSKLTPLSDEWIIEQSKHLSAKEINKKCSNILKLDKPIRSVDISFRHVWDLLSTCWGILEEKNWNEESIENYCENVKLSIINGENIIFPNFEEKPPPFFDERQGVIRFDDLPMQKIIR